MARASVSLVAEKSNVVSLLTDPFAFFGALGHFSLPLYWSEKSNSWVPLSRVDSVKVFKAVWVFLDPEKPEKPAYIVGTLAGPRVTEFRETTFVSYSFKGDDGENGLDINVKVTGDGKETVVEADFEVQSKKSFWGSILRKVSVGDDAGAHLLNDHLIPYLNKYVSRRVE